MSSEIAREWREKAEEDYCAAIILSQTKRKHLFSSICFHSQQSVEKYLKAYLSREKISFPKTHDLILLKNLCSDEDGDFELVSDLIISLNPYSVEFRYPGERAMRRDAMGAIKALKEIREFVRRKIRLK
ncbi:MAG: hypothetical protein A3G33_06770 [Omnitrophica bacterium RIFCSPLOWO2_12_FULL_44_17]|uniref:HEPN domain-containing protein n=1 Tax=Candidatus Danuiimicrobium aquiferis TaxID=1801832 RepID=A0A1G1L2N3_9BACT|nr:MAG: hypothetical protein A3B72_03350 [Omnitrophica bacterium RIFCSPHIGHO2_02_FULL_45_28]OGW99384.1 MAG: hypothetical protein A3G33_06770 [Omnitrophica bacterium RIFCSPLOWO2_12_FULL_44_17]OGX03430.1 MAG: hypothetical protein A3J12_11665 [Omnitrophica bacterium RIFCSPLOWO2_02_FULL_44_11]